MMIYKRENRDVTDTLLWLLKNRASVVERSLGYELAARQYMALERISRMSGREDMGDDALYRAGNSLLLAGKYRESLDLLGRAEGEAAKNGSEKALAAICQVQSANLRMMGQYQEAISSIDRAIDIQERLGDIQAVLKYQNNKGLILWRMGEQEEALGCYKISLDNARKSGDQAAESNCLNNIGLIYQDQERLEEALSCHLRALELRRPLKDLGLIISSLINAGNTLVQLEKLGEGERLWEEAMVLSQKMGDFASLAMLKHNRADLWYRRGEHLEALSLFRKALDIKRELGLRSYLASSMMGIAKTLYGLRRGKDDLQESRRLANEITEMQESGRKYREEAADLLGMLNEYESNEKGG